MDMNFTPTVQTPPDGMMVVAVLPDGLVKPIPQKWTAPPVAPMAGIEAAVADSYGPDARVVTVPQQEFPQHHAVHYREGRFTFTPVVQPPRELAPLNVDDVLELIGHFSGEQASALEAPAPEPTPEPIDASIIGPLETLKAKIDAVRAGTQELTPDELISMHRDDPPGAAAKLEDAIRALKGDARRKLSELLNVELAELKNLRGMAGEDREREQQIEYLLGLFTRLGEI